MANIAITPALTGYASITNFLLSSDVVQLFASNSSGTNWALGDGTIVKTLSSTYNHTYPEAGIYKACLLETTETSTITVFNYLPESLSFEAITTTSTPGASTCIVLNLTSNYNGPHEIDFYAVNSNSFPYNERGGLWTHLNPQWRFVDSNGLLANKLSVDGTAVYYNSALGITFNSEDIFIGTTARISAYYIDDLPSPLSGVEILATKSYGETINSRTSATTNIFVSANLPTGLSITTDGIQDLQPFYWQNTNILHTVNLTDGQNNLKFLPLANTSPVYIERVFLADSGDITSDVTFQQLSVKAYDTDNFTHIRGYIRDLASTPITATNVKISAKAVFSVDYNTLSSYNFFTPITGTQTFTLTGVSTEFNILTTTHNSFRRFNESENFTCLMKDFVNAPTFKNSEQFFDQYFGVVAGAEPVDEQQLGQKIMEKISNFAKNHSDVDVCNLDQFLNVAKQIDMDVEDFGLSYPERLKRIMDVASVEHKKVWGVRCPCKEAFGCSNCCGNICKTCGKNRADNLGSQLTIETATISVGTPVVIKYEQSDPIKYELYYPKALGALTAYPLSSLTAVNLKTPLTNYYSFYTYIPTPSNNQIDGLINWSDEYTTITETASSADNWYGDNQILDSIFNLELHKGLGLISQ